MAIDKELKKTVIEDWKSAFPQLTLYSQDKLYRAVGSIIYGLELIKLPRTDEYRPHFVVYPLWKKDVKASLDTPFIVKEFYNKKGLQYSIPYEKHTLVFSDVLESIKKQIPLPFEGNVSFKKIISTIDEYSIKPPLSAAPNSYLQASLQEAKFKITLFIGVTEAQSVLREITKRNWDINHFKACGVDINIWLQELQVSISKREEFLKQIDINKQDKKISQLISSEITL